MEKLRSGVPVLVSEVQACPRFATSLVDAVDYEWHVRANTIPEQDPTLLLEDCPSLGDSAVGLDGHALGKIKKFTIPTFSALEVLVLLRKALEDNDLSFSNICTLWSFFGGDPSCYRSLFRASKLRSCLTDTKQAEMEATTLLLQERARIREVLAEQPHIFELWGILSRKSRFRRQPSGAFSWLLNRGVVTQRPFLAPHHQAAFVLAPSFSQNGPIFYFGSETTLCQRWNPLVFSNPLASRAWSTHKRWVRVWSTNPS